jgi:uncharacterized protein
VQERNPFSFGDLALDERFTDREEELGELKADILNGQNVVLFAPRRYGKSSLVWRASQELVKETDVLIAHVDVMTTAAKEQLAAKIAQAVHDQIATPLLRARERATEIFRGLRIVPVITVDPSTGALGFSYTTGHAREDVDATLERLLELPAELSAARGRRAAIVFDEFQEVMDIDPNLPSLMRAVFQSQPDVAHVYLGSKRSMMARLFNDANEPFWRSAKQMELGVIPRAPFARFIRHRFQDSGRAVDNDVVAQVLDTTEGHPYGTQELCYALWEETTPGEAAGEAEFEAALNGVLRSENAHFTRIWDKASRTQRLTLQALAKEPLRAITSDDFRRRHGLPASSSIQRALDALRDDELIAKQKPGAYRISEPFLAEWILRYGA